MFGMIWYYIRMAILVQINRGKQSLSQYFQYNKLHENKISSSSLPYEDLTPKEGIDNSEYYINALDWALINKKINNIALTASYGAGKSSIIKTFQNKRPNYHYLNISLATFYQNKKNDDLGLGQDKGGADSQVDDNGFDDLEIEKSILQQLFYRVQPDQIPYSRFRKIKNIKLFQILMNVGVMLLTMLLGLILIKPSIIDRIKSNITMLETYIESRFIISIGYIIFYILVTLLIARFIRAYASRLRLSKVNIQKAELELDQANDESVFNKYLDEILYFFEVTKYNVIFIEDLDRFKNTKIFIKLRELNILLNNSKQINRRIVFVYAIKDDMFRNGDRTKFFDFIIPVIPVINSTNSGEKLLEKIRQNKFGEHITDEYINGVSVYIDDMRILNNIYNEFVLYINILKDLVLKSDQILSLIIYKNLYPNDFAELQYKRGIIYRAFKNKKAYIQEKIASIQSEIDRLQEKIECANQDCLSSIKELKVAFLYNLLGMSKEIIKINSPKGEYSVSEILSDDFNLEIFNGERLTIEYISSYRNDYYNNSFSRSSTNSSMEEANKRSGSEFTYLQRIDNIKFKNKIKQDELKQKIEALKTQQRTLNTWTLKQLIDKFGAKEVLGETVYKEKLIVYLIRNGHIDEQYPNYLTYFYPNSLTIQDMNFILGIRNFEAYEFSYPITKIQRVISKLNDHEFQQKEILNFALFDFLLENKEKYQDNFNTIIKQLADETPISFSFIDEFKDQTKFKKEFWVSICHQWSNIWNYIEDSSNLPSAKKDLYLKNIIEYAEIPDIEAINYENRIVAYISKNDEFLQLMSGVDLLKVKQVISKFNIKFESINISNVSGDLLNYVFENNYYAINPQMIKTIVHIVSPENQHLLDESNLSIIKKINYVPMLEYINNNIEEYLNNVFLKLETNVNENIETIVELLNKSEEEITNEIKYDIINKQNFKLSNISIVPELLWSKVFNSSRLEISWENVFIYYEKVKTIDDTLERFLNKEEVYHNLLLNRYEVDKEESEEGISSSFTDQLIKSSISDKTFDNLAESIPYEYDEYETEDISPKRCRLSSKIDPFFNIFTLNFDPSI